MDEADMQRLCSITIIDLNCKEIHLKTVMYEMVFELREFLADHAYTCFFTNFYFEHAGQRLNEYSELSELDLASNPRIIMKPGKSTEKLFLMLTMTLCFNQINMTRRVHAPMSRDW